MSEYMTLSDKRKFEHRHDVSGWLLAILIIGIVGMLWVWGRKVTTDREQLETALASVTHLKQELAQVTNELDAHIINMGIESRIVVDKNGIIILCSPTAAEVCGYLPKELLGKPSQILVPPDMKDAHTKAFKKSFANVNEEIGKVSIVRCLLLKKDGTTRPVEIIVRLVEDSGEPRAVVTITPVEKIEFTPALPGASASAVPYWRLVPTTF